jgi:hypothetical protein
MRLKNRNLLTSLTWVMLTVAQNTEQQSQRLRLASRYFSLLFLITQILIAQNVFAQAPAVEWRRSDWFPTHPVTGPQSQQLSGEDWWYDHKNSYIGSSLNGFICAGFSSFRNWSITEPTSGCLTETLGTAECRSMESTGNLRGSILATMALISQDGNTIIWFKTYNSGYFYRVIQTSDGGYLAVGFTASTRQPNGSPLFYNPNQSGSQTDYFSDPQSCTAGNNMPHAMMVKTDATGNVQWQYIYGMVPFTNASQAYQSVSNPWDVIETPTGFRMVGNALDQSFTYFCGNQTLTLPRAFMIEVDKNGLWQWGKFYGSTLFPGNACAINKYMVGGNLKYVVSGTEHFTGSTFNGYTGCFLYQKVYVRQFDDAASPSIQWERSSFDLSNTTASQSTYDIQISANSEILLPVIENCTGCLYSGYNSGVAKVYRLDNLGNIISATSFGQVTAFDLKARLTPTADGGFALISTKQVNPPPLNFGCFDETFYWNTDAYVAKVNACGNIEWATTFNVDNNPPAPYPLDLKKQECMYSISQHTDGGFVVSGNNSYNFDDNYLVKLLPATQLNVSLYMQDTPQDIGLEPNPDTGPMWVSDDIWIRPDASSGFSDDTHLNPEYGMYSYVYVRVRNKGCQTASGNLNLYWAKGSTGLGWNTQWINYAPTPVFPCTAPVLYGDKITNNPIPITLAPNSQTIVAIPWLPPNPNDFSCFTDQGHFCLLARIETSSGMTFPEVIDVNANVNGNNKIVWKNVTVVDNFLRVGVAKKSGAIVRNASKRDSSIRLSFNIPKEERRSSFYKYGTVRVNLGKELFREWESKGMIGSGIKIFRGTTISILQPDAWIGGINLKPGEMHNVGIDFILTIQPPANGRNIFNLDLVQSSLNKNPDEHSPDKDPAIKKSDNFRAPVNQGADNAIGGIRFTIRTKKKPVDSGPPLVLKDPPKKVRVQNRARQRTIPGRW